MTLDPKLKLQRDLGAPAPVPASGLRRAQQLIERGYLTRYGEFGGERSEVALLERDFAAYLGCQYAVAVNSCGSALYLALRCCGVSPGDLVLMNAFTLAPVPGAINHAGATPVYVECNDQYLIDLEDLARKAQTGARVLLLSHMRGHLADMGLLTNFCERHDLTLIEDCAHTLGAKWDGTHSGRFGRVGCFSFQSYKHVNAGEGGMLVTDDAEVAAKAILFSGSYMLYEQNGAAPPQDVFARYQEDIPNLSLRMGEVTAALARPQIPLLEQRRLVWNAHYDDLERRLAAIHNITVPKRDSREAYVASSIQFSIGGFTRAHMHQLVDYCAARGVKLKWFGREEAVGFTSNFEHWRYAPASQEMRQTQAALGGLCDMRIPLTLTTQDAELIAQIIAAGIDAVN